MRLIGIAFLAGSMALGACKSIPKPQAGGKASSSLSGGLKEPSYASLSQPENPGDRSKQEIRREEKREDIVPVSVVRVTETPQKDGTVVKVTEHFAPQVSKVEVKEESKTELGAAQKDVSREVAARLASFKGIQWFGAALIVGAAAMFHPVVRTVVGGGKQIQMALAAGGLALIFGPTIIVGREWLIAVVTVVGLLIYWLTSRLAYKEGRLDSKVESK